MKNSKKHNFPLTITPMGGVAEIGSNMTVFETANYYLVIDYGILFPYEDFFDINYLIVDSSLLKEEKEIILFITHGHEDHIGAVSHFIQKYPKTKIYAPQFATSLIRSKLERRKISNKITVYNEDDIIEVDQLELHPVHVTHSIPHTFGIVIKDKKDLVSFLFISDFKYDLKPVYEKPFNFQKIAKLFNSSQKRICFLDSTNILNTGKTASESELEHDIDYLLSQNKRTFITLFSSNIFRIKTILKYAKKHNKKVTSVGRSIKNYLETAFSTNLIDEQKEPIIDFEAIQNYEDPNIIILLTGCQGDHFGALRRIASREHKKFKLNVGDQVLFSSKPIPGNSKKISRIYNEITKQGAEVITNNDYMIHASGHPGQEDLKLLLEKINPTDYIPIHGESYFLKKHFDFIEENYDFTPHLIENFHQLQFDDKYDFNLKEFEVLEPIIIHGNDIELEREKVSERRKIACNGCLFITINHKKRRLLLETKGIPGFADQYAKTFIPLLKECAFIDHKNKDSEQVSEQVRIKSRQLYSNILGYKPISIVHTL